MRPHHSKCRIYQFCPLLHSRDYIYFLGCLLEAIDIRNIVNTGVSHQSRIFLEPVLPIVLQIGAIAHQRYDVMQSIFYTPSLLIQSMFLTRAVRFFNASNKIHWREKNSGIQMFFKSTKMDQAGIVFINQGFTFKMLAKLIALPANFITFPDGVNLMSDAHEFLLQDKKPKIIQITKAGQKYILKNKACDPVAMAMKRATDYNQKSIYGYLKLFKKNNPQLFGDDLMMRFAQTKNYLIRYYLKLEVEAYCKKRGLLATARLTDSNKQEILSYLSERFQIDANQKIAIEKQNLSNLIYHMQQISTQIDTIQSRPKSFFQIYKLAIIVGSVIFIVSFAYMIFFVEWLGWDIIEPLTYTIGVLSVLLAIRFYWRYGQDRSQETIKQTLMNKFMTSKERELRKMLTQKAAQLQKQKANSERLIKIYENRLAKMSTVFME